MSWSRCDKYLQKLIKLGFAFRLFLFIKISKWSSDFLKYIQVSDKLPTTTKMAGVPMEGDPLHPTDAAVAAKRQAQFAAQKYFKAGYMAYFKRPVEDIPRLESIICPSGHWVYYFQIWNYFTISRPTRYRTTLRSSYTISTLRRYLPIIYPTWIITYTTWLPYVVHYFDYPT